MSILKYLAMKKTSRYILAAFLLVIQLPVANGQGVESFDDFNPSDWYNGTWEGNNSQMWTFVNCKGFSLYSPTRTVVRFGHKTGTVSSTFSGGLGSIKLALFHLWGETETPQQMEVVIEGESYGTFQAGFRDSGNGHNDSTTIYTIDEINIEGTVQIELIGNSNLGLDSLIWTDFTDTENPSPPQDMDHYNITKSSFSISWSGATDNSGIAGYDVYLDEAFRANTEDDHYTFTGLQPGQSYSVKIVAVDLSGNRSDPSTSVSVTTLPADAPEIGLIPDVSFYLNSGENIIFLPEIDDGNPGEVEEIGITATSVDPSLVEVLSVEYDPQNTCGYLRVLEKGALGSTKILVELDDNTTVIEKSIRVSVVPYSKPGIHFEVHDLVFWDEKIPIGQDPVFDTIISEASGPPEGIEWENLELTVSQDCDAPQCDGHDFITLMYRGYVIPPADGDYTFFMEGVGDYGLWLSSDENYENANGIAVKSSGQHQVVGTDQSDGTWASEPQTLEKGKVYAIYGINWTIHTTTGGILWEGPGISKSYLQGEEIMHIYDTQKPSSPQALDLIARSTETIKIAWQSSSDNQELAGYYIYLNGIRNSEEPLQDTVALIEGLAPDTKYTIAVTAMDDMGNESAPGSLLTSTTYQMEDIAPTAPEEITAEIVESMAVQISWSGATDNQAVFAYNVYLDGHLYNSDDYIYEQTLVMKPLMPEKSYQITIESIDVAMNVSSPSAPHTITTKAFDPGVNTLGEKMGRLTIEMSPVGLSEGIGINPEFQYGEFMNAEQRAAIDELRPGNIRWGTITANRLSFDDYIGNDKTATIADFAKMCVDNNAYLSFTCGMDSNTDWYGDESTFLNFLEYLAGPSSSGFGEIRAEEGYEEPLLDQLPGLVFEFGNEVWGSDVHFAPIGADYSDYAGWAREKAELMKTSDYYDAEKIKFAYSGRNPNPDFSYGLNKLLLTGDRGEIELLSLGGYIGSNFDGAEIDQGDSYLDYYKNAREDGLLDIKGLDYYHKLAIGLTGDFKLPYLYETNTKNDTYNGRLGHAMIITDYWLSAMEKGSFIPTIYSLSHGQWRITAPGEDYKRLPVFHTASYFNTFCRGEILKTDYHSLNKVYNGSGKELEMDAVGSYAYHSNGNYTIVLISRDFENDHFVEISLPDGFTFQQSAWQYVISGEDYSTFDAVVDSSELTFNNNYLITVPRHSMVLVNFSGEIQDFGDVASGFFTYDKISSIELYAEKTEITEDGGELMVEAITIPGDDYIGKVDWEITQGDIDVTLQRYDKSCRVESSGHQNGNGLITLRASALDNPDIYDEIDIMITGQGTTGVITNLKKNRVEVYPNPSKGYFSLKIYHSTPESRLWITDLTGRIVNEFDAHQLSSVLSFGGQLKKGVYILNYSDENVRVSRTLIKH